MPTNLYGPGDNYHELNNVLPALIRKFKEAKKNNVKNIIVGVQKSFKGILYMT